MKTLSRTITLITLSAVGITSILIFHACNKAQFAASKKLELIIPPGTPVTHLGDFTGLLNKNCKPKGADDCNVDIHVGGRTAHGPPFDEIETANIIKAERADPGSAKDRLSHVTQKIASDNPKNLIDVLNTF